MATKTVVTRIKNKVDTLAKWSAYAGTLLNGEIAVVRVPTGDTYTNPVTGVDEPVVELLMKVGDGSTTFANLPWMSAKASDVYDWGKAKTVEFNTSTYKVEFKDASNNVILAVDLTAIDARLDALESKKITVTPNDSSKPGVVQSVSQGDASHEIDVTYGLIKTADIDSKQVTAAKIADSTITATQLASNAVSTSKIADGAVTDAKVAAGVSSDKISVGTSTTSGTLSAKLSAMDAAIEAADTKAGHDHPYLPNTTKYAASSSVGGAATSANKVNKSVTFKATDGAAAGTTFDGSAAVTVSYTTVGAAAASHTHDDRYYTETEINAKVEALNSAIDGKAASGHNHDSVYITPAAVDTKINTALGSVLKYKGTKSSTSELPTSNNATGDVYNITNACAATSTLPKVNAGDNVAWNGSSWDVLAGTIDLSNYYTETEIDSKLSTKSDTDHTHKYAGSSSAGGAATSANKVNKAVTFNSGGQGAASGTTFDGSTARTISYNTIGAAAATHSHTKSEITDFAHNHDDQYYTEAEVNSLLAGKQDTHTHPYLPDSTKYAGSATQGGAANSVANALTVKLNSGTAEGTTMFTFNGSAAKTVNVTAGGVGAYTKAETDALLATKQASGNYAASSHAHGNITNSGTITATAVTAASGVVVVDSSNKVQKVTDMSKFRTIIGAGTSSLTLGTTATTAAKGNHTHASYEADITAIEANYLRIDSSNKLVQHVSGTDTEIIFDCGGAE